MILEMLAGCGCAVAGVVVGHFEGFLMGSKVRNATELFARPDDGLVWCTCGHPKSSHDSGTGMCNDLMQHKDGNLVKDRHLNHVGCKCQVFVGDPSKQPIASDRPGLLDLF